MNTLGLFFLVSLASTATPGPAVLYVTSQGVTAGSRSGLSAVLGVLAADAFYIALSVTGLSAVLAASYQLFTFLKWAGVVYLLYLGTRLLWSALFISQELHRPLPSAGLKKAVLGGFAIHAANPKAFLYFGSLVPQFVDPAGALAPQLASLALIHLSTATCVLVAYTLAAAHFRHASVSARTARAFKAAAGSALVGAGISMALVRKS